MGGLFDRGGEMLNAGPSASVVLEAVGRYLATLTPDLVVQPARAGPWTAFYRAEHLIALARPTPGTGGSLDVAAPGISWAATLSAASELQDARTRAALQRAVARAPESGIESFAAETGSWGGAVGTLLALAAIVAGVGSWIVRTRRERANAAATGTQRELAILNAARGEIRRRVNSLTLGCLGAVLIGFVTFVVVIYLGAWLAREAKGLAPVAALLWLVPLGAAFLGFRSVRQRYPSPPQTRSERWTGRLIALLLGGFAVAIILGIVASRP